MRFSIQPTTGQTISARLFLRFFLCYFAGVALAVLCAGKGARLSCSDVGSGQLLFVLLALPGALSTVAKPYLLLLSIVKAFYDVAWLYTLFDVAPHLSNAFLTFNACLLFLVFSLLLFCFTTSKACLFAASTYRRDLQLILSRAFLSFLVEALLFAALALSLYFIWPQLAALYM